MKISYHAAERFLERVMSKKKYNHQDVEFAMRYLERLFQHIVIVGVSKHFVIPGFENYKAVYVHNTIITIIPKT